MLSKEHASASVYASEDVWHTRLSADLEEQTRVEMDQDEDVGSESGHSKHVGQRSASRGARGELEQTVDLQQPIEAQPRRPRREGRREVE